MSPGPTFEELIAEGDAVPTAGWDFSWFDGRATEERPSGYAGLLTGQLAQARAVLDIQTGGGEVLAGALRGAARPPALLAATESWPPNLELARRRLRPFGVVVAAADDADLPFRDGCFSLVVSRASDEGAVAGDRARADGGRHLFLAAGRRGIQPGATDFMMGPQPVHPGRRPRVAAAEATAAGLQVTGLREQALRVEFFDVAAVVHFLRKVLWTVPGFAVAGYRDELARMHEHIQSAGSFVRHSQRFLIEGRRPG